MSDIIETIDREYAKLVSASVGGSPTAYQSAALELSATLVSTWPALRDRLVAAERKARALQTLANSAVICEACEALRCWEPHVRVLGNVNAGDLLTAIEAATREHSS